MHGLTGGSWKRSADLATVTEKNNSRETAGHQRLPRPTANRRHRASSRPCGCRNPVMSCDLRVFVEKAAEAVSPQWPGRAVGGWGSGPARWWVLM
jgi:hypothetical protein